MFDTILNRDSIESSELEEQPSKSTLSYETKHKDVTCQCRAVPRESQTHSIDATEEATILAETTISPKTTIISEHITTTKVITETTDHTTYDNFSTVRPDPHLPLLPPRNTTGSWRNNNRFLEGSGTSRNWSYKGDISGDHRVSEHNSQEQGHDTSTEHDRESTFSTARDSSSSIRPGRGNGISFGNDSGGASKNVKEIKADESTTETGGTSKNVKEIEADESTTEAYTLRETGRLVADFKIQNKDEVRRDQTENSRVIPQHIPGLLRGGFVSENEELYRRETVQPVQNTTSSDIILQPYYSSYKQFSIGNGTASSKIQRVVSETKAILNNIPIQMLNNDFSNKNNKKVSIIDGYSVTRGKTFNKAKYK